MEGGSFLRLASDLVNTSAFRLYRFASPSIVFQTVGRYLNGGFIGWTRGASFKNILWMSARVGAKFRSHSVCSINTRLLLQKGVFTGFSLKPFRAVLTTARTGSAYIEITASGLTCFFFDSKCSGAGKAET